MQRKIKFRVWNKVWKCMYYLAGFRLVGKTHIQLYYIDDDGDSTTCTVLLENIILMPYTGLKDNNDKEIYEGDIVRHFEEIGFVKWMKDRFVIEWKSENWHYREDLAFWSIERKIDVVNNIYENQELLQEASNE